MLAIILSICGLILFVYIFIPRAPLDGRSAFSSVVMPNRESFIYPASGLPACRINGKWTHYPAHQAACFNNGGSWEVASSSAKWGTGGTEVYGSNWSDALTMLSNDLQRIALPVFIIVGGFCLALAIFVYSRRRLWIHTHNEATSIRTNSRKVNGYEIKPNANLQGANLSNTDLNGTDLTYANLQGAILTGVNLAGAILTGVNLSNVNLEGANLAGDNLKDANLSNANLEGTNLQGVNLWGANLSNTNLKGANLKGANLFNANLEGAILIGAILTGAILTGVNLRVAILSDTTMPDGTKHP